MKKYRFTIIVLLISLSYIIAGIWSLRFYNKTLKEEALSVGYAFTIIGVAMLSAFLLIKLKIIK